MLYSQCAAIGLSSILILVMAQNRVWSSYKFYKAKLMVSPLWDYNNQITMTDRGVKQYVIIELVVLIVGFILKLKECLVKY